MERTTKRHLTKKHRALAVAAAVSVAVTGIAGIFAFAEQEPTYEKDITIANVLTDFQYFVQGDFTGSGHIVGAMAIGGAIDFSNRFGDGQSVTSYFHEIINTNLGTGNYWSGPKNAYYGINSTGGTLNSTDFIENDDYLDMDAAFSALVAQSQALAEQPSITYTMNETEQLFSWVPDSKVLKIDVTQGENFVIPWSVFSQINAVDLVGYSDATYFTTHKVNISVTDVPADKTPVLSAAYPALASGVVYQLWNGQSSDQYFKDQLENANQMTDKHGNEIFLQGFKLIWNFPDAQTLKMYGTGGHIVAPQADLTNAGGGRFEGGIIAKSIVTDGAAEAHYYSYFDILNGDEPAETTVATTTTAGTTTTTAGTTTTTAPATTTTTTAPATTTTTTAPATTTTTTAPATTTTTTAPATTTTTTAPATTTTTTAPANTTTTTAPATTTTTTTTEGTTTSATDEDTTTTTTIDFVGGETTTTGDATTTTDLSGENGSNTTTKTGDATSSTGDATTTTDLSGENGSKTTTTTDLDGNNGEKTTTSVVTTDENGAIVTTQDDSPAKTSKDSKEDIGGGAGGESTTKDADGSDVSSSKTGATITLSAIVLLLSATSVTIAYKSKKTK